MYPAKHSEVFQTQNGTPYLKESGVVMLCAPEPSYSGLQEFLEGFNPELGFNEYNQDNPLQDDWVHNRGAEICKLAGQTCYLSFGPNRTKNAEAKKYLDNILSSGHGSVLEHANYTFILYGVSRSLSHELVRHRAGMGYSQLSQRYVGGKMLRFVERPEYQENLQLHDGFEGRIDSITEDYNSLTLNLLGLQKEWLEREAGQAGRDKVFSNTELRKKLQQCSRSILPNETETIIVVTGNARAWRTIIEQRVSEHAEIEICNCIYKVWECLNEIDPLIFGDYVTSEGKDGRKILTTQYRKV